ncbi:nuclease-related domain-containing protein [Bhargavaea ullalensis]|uniref:NERD domain-containing protein n=1 Tax=Bhargavaea ullalensis TaxID=1265685 RepID=A0ABV2GD24_9BACL
MQERRYPIDLVRARRSEFRLVAGHEKKKFFGEQASRIEAGYKGELAVDQYLRHVQLPGWWTVLRDVRLEISHNYIAQFDTLIITEKGIWIIEAKMIRGTLHWLEYPRRIERIEPDGTVLTFDCPIIQVENQKVALRNWLLDRNLDIPVAGVVAFATKNTWMNLPANSTIISVKELHHYLNKSFRNLPLVENSLAKSAFIRIHTEQLGPDLTTSAERHHLLKTDFLTGLLCDNCGSELDRDTQRQYSCTRCRRVDSDESIARALLDYVLTIKPVVTTKEFVSFLKVVPESTARRHLGSHLDPIGWGKTAAYSFCALRHLHKDRLKKRES